MSFSNTIRNFAINSEIHDQLLSFLLKEYGEIAVDNGREIITIGVHWHNDLHELKRAASIFDGTITGSPLSDGRTCYSFMAQSDLEEEFLSNGIDGVEELTDEQFKNLMAESDMP